MYIRELQELEAQMALLIEGRRRRVMTANAMIEKANRDFDENAAPLGRRINKLRKELEKENKSKQPARRRSPSPPNLDGLTKEEREFYLRLLKEGRK